MKLGGVERRLSKVFKICKGKCKGKKIQGKTILSVPTVNTTCMQNKIHLNLHEQTIIHEGVRC